MQVADQAFSEADKDGSGEVDVDEFFEFAKSSLSCAILCDRFEHATKALVEDVTAKRRQEQERRYGAGGYRARTRRAVAVQLWHHVVLTSS